MTGREPLLSLEAYRTNPTINQGKSRYGKVLQGMPFLLILIHKYTSYFFFPI